MSRFKKKLDALFEDKYFSWEDDPEEKAEEMALKPDLTQEPPQEKGPEKEWIRPEEERTMQKTALDKYGMLEPTEREGVFKLYFNRAPGWAGRTDSDYFIRVKIVNDQIEVLDEEKISELQPGDIISVADRKSWPTKTSPAKITKIIKPFASIIDPAHPKPYYAVGPKGTERKHFYKPVGPVKGDWIIKYVNLRTMDDGKATFADPNVKGATAGDRMVALVFSDTRPTRMSPDRIEIEKRKKEAEKEEEAARKAARAARMAEIQKEIEKHKPLEEGLDPAINKVFRAFDEHLGTRDIPYNLSVDEASYQSYFVPKEYEEDIPAIEDAMTVEAAKNNVHLQVDKDKRGTHFKFSIAALNELEEDQYKSPTRKYLRDQSAFPSSFGKSRTFGGVSDYNGGKKKTKKKRGK